MNKENITHNIEASNQFKKNGISSMRQLSHVRKQNAKRLQEIEEETHQKLQSIQLQHEQQKTKLVQKYQQMIKEKDQYITMLEHMFSKDQSLSSSKSYFSHSHQLVLHQDPLYEQLCQKRPSKHLHNTSKCMVESIKPPQTMNRKKSSSKHKLNPIPKPLYLI